MTTYCRDCTNVHSDTRGSDPWRWRCMCVPVAAGFGFVDPTYAPDPPYALCSKVNQKGECDLFRPIPEPSDDNQPKTKQFVRHKRELEATNRT